jgi:uncharacterized protein YwgA
MTEVVKLRHVGKIRQGNKMATCPYSETITDQLSNIEVLNPKYIAWNEGYEAHKLETVTSLKQLEMKFRELEAKKKQCDEFARNLSASIADVRHLKTALDARNANLAKRL